MRRSRSAASSRASCFTSALAATLVPAPFPTGGNRLADQLALVACMIAARQQLGTRRQGVFVSIGGFDTHDNQMGTHPGILGQVGSALAAFYRATETLGIASQVTAFTASRLRPHPGQQQRWFDHGSVPRTLCWVAVAGGCFVGPAPARQQRP